MAEAEESDFLVIRAGNGNATERINGTILDINGRTGAIIRVDGQDTQIPMEKVVHFGTTMTEAHVNGEQAMKVGDYKSASELFRAARTEESRIWVKRQITARLVQALTAQKEFEQASREFYLLAQSDPETPYMASIPIPWFTSLDGGQEQIALRLGKQGIDRADNPAMQLLAAGLLLTSPQRNKALEVLERLSKSPNKSIAAIATAQLWRPKLFDATMHDALAWEELTDAMPEPVRAGPHYLLGGIFARLKEPENAVAHWMKVPILFPEQRELAERSRSHAASTLESLGRPEQAEKLRTMIIGQAL